MASDNYESEENERNKVIKKFHDEGDDISRSTLDLNRMESLKKKGKNPKDYGYDESMGYTRHSEHR